MAEDLGRWLRRVRPPTEADDDWIDTPAAQELLGRVHRATGTAPANGPAGRGSRGPRARRPLRRRVWVPVLAAAAGTAALVVGLVVSAGGADRNPSAAPSVGPPIATPRTAPVGARPAALLLADYSSCDDLLRGLRSHAAAAVGPSGLPSNALSYAVPTSVTTDAGVASSASAPGRTGSPTDSSGTNVQEAGVDEPDIVKAIDGRMVSVTDGVLRIVDTTTKKVTGRLDLTLYDGWAGAQLLVSADSALVVLTPQIQASAAYRYGYSAPSPVSTYLFVDLSGAPRVTGSLRASGRYLDARLVGTTMRLIVSSAPTINLPYPAAFGGSVSGAKRLAANKAAVRRAPLSAWLPQYSITDGSSVVDRTQPCQQVSHPAAYTGAALVTLYTLDMAHLAADPQPVTVAADGDTVYATAGSLYVASNPNWYCCPSAATTQKTEIHRFDITGSALPTYLGSATVPGRLLNRFSLSDYADHLRVATTTGSESSNSSNGVYVLDARTLAVTGKVVGLARGQQIYAVRFLGAMAYLVTYRQVDPLYVLDLGNPRVPRVVGSLHLPGYSTYLQDAGGGRLIGVGPGSSSWPPDLQVSLFDVGHPSAPTRTGVVHSINAIGTYIDPHQFLYWAPTGLVVVPLQTWDSAQAARVLVLRVVGTKLQQVGVLANPAGSLIPDDHLGIQRSAIVDGALWTLSGSGIQVTSPTTLARSAFIAFH